MNQMCLITLGRIIIAARRSRGLSQRELCEVLSKEFALEIDFKELSKIENDHLNVRDRSYDCFIQCFCEIFDADPDYIEQIRQQTEVQPFDLSKAVFPVYFHDIDFNG